MLYARRWGTPKLHYRIAKDGKRLTTWTPLHKGGEGGFVLDGVEYAVVSDQALTHAVLMLDDATPIAVAEGLGRNPWTVRTDSWVHTFHRTLDRWTEQQLVAGGRQIGVVRQAGKSGRHAEADLPGMPEPVAVFALAVVLGMWRAADRRRTG